MGNWKKLRFKKPESAFPIVLVAPEIPPNTGNAARLCAATGSSLHLVEPLGFSIEEKAVKRAGLDYWHLVDVHKHKNLNDCLNFINAPVQPLLFTSRSFKSFTEAPYKPGTPLIFGRETKGLDIETLNEFPDRCYAIPTCGPVRSLNLSNAVAIIVYEALKKTGQFNELLEDV